MREVHQNAAKAPTSMPGFIALLKASLDCWNRVFFYVYLLAVGMFLFLLFTVFSKTSNSENLQRFIAKQLFYHPSIFHCLSMVRSGQQPKQGHLDIPDPCHLIWWEPNAFPGQLRYIVPPWFSRSSQGLLLMGHAWKTSPGRRPGAI